MLVFDRFRRFASSLIWLTLSFLGFYLVQHLSHPVKLVLYRFRVFLIMLSAFQVNSMVFLASCIAGAVPFLTNSVDFMTGSVSFMSSSIVF